MDPVAPHTLRELHILSDRHEPNMFNFFDHTHTQGGRDALKILIQNPLKSISEINAFQDIIKLQADDISKWKIGVARSYIAAAELYYSSSISYTMSQDVFKHWMDSWMFSQLHPTEFSKVQSGLSASIQFLQAFKTLIDYHDIENLPEGLKIDFDNILKFFNRSTVKSLLQITPHKVSKSRTFYLDYYLRIKHRKAFREIIEIYYRFDAYCAIAETTIKHNLIFPEFEENHRAFEADGLWQPLIKNAVSNSLSMNDGHNLCILTGANTSGKTTFLKNCGMVVYLAHLGWPVPARKLKLPFLNKLFTSIQLSDDMGLGHSHFFSEVMRIRDVAQALNNGDRCFVIIDELFRGTNTEDGLNCSRLVLNGFRKHTGSIFLISTHLFELFQELLAIDTISFRCFKTTVSEFDFENTFRIENGIALEKIGRMILEKSGIRELLG